MTTASCMALPPPCSRSLRVLPGACCSAATEHSSEARHGFRLFAASGDGGEMTDREAGSRCSATEMPFAMGVAQAFAERGLPFAVLQRERKQSARHERPRRRGNHRREIGEIDQHVGGNDEIEGANFAGGKIR